MLKEKLKLSFDPEKSSDDIRQVFANKTARTLWLGVKQGNLTNQYFEQSCLECAKVIDSDLTQGKKIDAEKLFYIISNFTRHSTEGLIASGQRDYARQLLPFVLGEKEFQYEIVLA